jgi:hypothetical protein
MSSALPAQSEYVYINFDMWRGLLVQNQSLSTSSGLSPWELPWIFNPSSQNFDGSSQHTSLEQGRSHLASAILIIPNSNSLSHDPSFRTLRPTPFVIENLVCPVCLTGYSLFLGEPSFHKPSSQHIELHISIVPNLYSNVAHDPSLEVLFHIEISNIFHKQIMSSKGTMENPVKFPINTMLPHLLYIFIYFIMEHIH